MKGLYYILNGRDVVPVDDVLEWAQWFETNPNGRSIAYDRRGGVTVSTIFIGLANPISGDPQVFETMIFGGDLDGTQKRYSTYAAAVAGHKTLCDLAGVPDILAADTIETY